MVTSVYIIQWCLCPLCLQYFLVLFRFFFISAIAAWQGNELGDHFSHLFFCIYCVISYDYYINYSQFYFVSVMLFLMLF